MGCIGYPSKSITMLTSFRSDGARIRKEMEISSFPGRYALDVPGPGLDMPMMDDVHTRMQTWGANRRTNMVALESDLKGMTRKLNRDNLTHNDYTLHKVNSVPLAQYKAQDPYTLESRASHPSWMYRERETLRWETPFLNPQANLEKKFHSNLQTRMLEKDHFQEPTVPWTNLP
jgi:hypothetical protein